MIELGAARWDSRDRWSLRFSDKGLESQYLHDTVDAARIRVFWACLINVPYWVAVAIFGPIVFSGIDPLPVYVIAAVVIAALAVAAFLARWATSRTAIDRVRLSINIVTGASVIVLTATVGLFDRFAAMGILIVAVIALTFMRLPFTLSLAAVVFHLTLFTAVGLVYATALLFQLFVLASALGILLVGVYLAESRERQVYVQGLVIADLHRRVDELFHRYLSPGVAQTLIDNPSRTALGGEEVEVTVLFADLRGFTPFAEGRQPSEVVDMLNTAYSAVVPQIFAEGGTVIQVVGDAIMAVFNAPLRQPDHALRAARSALALQRGVEALGDDDERPRFRVGLNSGPALVGNIGSAELRNFTAIGDTTNLAARIQTFAQPGKVVIGERTRHLLGAQAKVRPLGSPELKGKKEVVQLFELISVGDL